MHVAPTARRALAAVVAAVAISGSLLAAPAVAHNGTNHSPTKEDVAAEQQRAATLEEQAARQRKVVEAAQATLDALATVANEALAVYGAAKEEADLARDTEKRETERLEKAKAEVVRSRAELESYVAAAYRTGLGGNSEMATFAALLDAEGPTDFLRGASMMEQVGDRRAEIVDRLRAAEAEQQAATVAAQQAKVTAEAAEVKATAAKDAAYKAVAAQRSQVDVLARELAKTQNAVADAKAKAARLEKARVEAERRAREEADRMKAIAGCQGGSVSGYPNGRIPTSKLCALWGAPGHMLRADAAGAFNRMSQAYAEDFGYPICVTDSYRSYDEQVDVKRRKGKWAATPGTSNHGWARATDLGCGIQYFGSTEYNWMKRNAPRFGWYHPAWAEPSGSLPEPWHWEYGG